MAFVPSKSDWNRTKGPVHRLRNGEDWVGYYIIGTYLVVPIFQPKNGHFGAINDNQPTYSTHQSLFWAFWTKKRRLKTIFCLLWPLFFAVSCVFCCFFAYFCLSFLCFYVFFMPTDASYFGLYEFLSFLRPKRYTRFWPLFLTWICYGWLS